VVLQIISRESESVSSAKYLGITLQSDLKWTQHANNIVANANKSLGLAGIPPWERNTLKMYYIANELQAMERIGYMTHAKQ
jgi:hypothetical protein